ncbi:hypothetical protein PR202_gb16282 [Eleusine coracana subsp. coracana]|uniref:Uncharacterized protein n=1 Tax=Eleusine coracana subsp. coracana TaxID=191504 RepID=A0AAV5F1J5_ELECO|nr:hypothetical protein PR202_gb16282 [Eleusine coracana subsp. coracana]
MVSVSGGGRAGRWRRHGPREQRRDERSQGGAMAAEGSCGKRRRNERMAPAWAMGRAATGQHGVHRLDAAADGRKGNEYFKQKKFAEAIDCHSRSIVLSPTAVAFANRAMAYLKLRRQDSFMEVDSPVRAAVEIIDNADRRSKGGSGVKINDNIMQL